MARSIAHGPAGRPSSLVTIVKTLPRGYSGGQLQCQFVGDRDGRLTGVGLQRLGRPLDHWRDDAAHEVDVLGPQRGHLGQPQASVRAEQDGRPNPVRYGVVQRPHLRRRRDVGTRLSGAR